MRGGASLAGPLLAGILLQTGCVASKCSPPLPAVQIYAGLQHMHGLGLAHRDVKAHNVLVTRSRAVHPAAPAPPAGPASPGAAAKGRPLGWGGNGAAAATSGTRRGGYGALPGADLEAGGGAGRPQLRYCEVALME